MNRLSAQVREKIVLEALKGIELTRLSREFAIREDHIASWVRIFLNGGFNALSEATFHEVTNELAIAVAHDQLVNHYQPQIALDSGRIVGFEALVRWRHPRCGLLGPEHFIAAAERSGLISSVAVRVLGEALRQAAEWRREGLPSRVAVNLSVDNFIYMSDLLDILERELRRWGLSGERLTLEVTETRAISGLEEVLPVMEGIRAMGVRLSVDDFGTGFSTLEELMHLNLDEVKIDRQFVHRADRDHKRAAIFGSSLGLAKELGVRVVAEGVEDERDLLFVRRSGCDVAQGHFVSPPLRVEAIPDFLRSWEARREALFG